MRGGVSILIVKIRGRRAGKEWKVVILVNTWRVQGLWGSFLGSI